MDDRDGRSPVLRWNSRVVHHRHHPRADCPSKQKSQTVSSVDGDEDNVALTALSEDGIEDMLGADFPKSVRASLLLSNVEAHQTAGKTSLHDTLEGREERFVHD